MKQLGTFALATALTGSLLTPALAAGYATSITVNGTTLDTSALPEAQGLPLRLVAEADHGSASWFAEENSSSFYFSKHRVEAPSRTAPLPWTTTWWRMPWRRSWTV